MAILKIARMGHPVLRRPADDVADPTAPEIRALASDMLETMIDAPGVGLAAPQVHEPLRMVIFRVPLTEVESMAGGEPPLTVLINPTLEPQGEEMEENWEGCLSLPGLRGLVPRYTHLRYRGVDLDGQEIDRTVDGFHARVVQHECDHLEGILYPQRMRDLTGLIFESEMRHVIAEIRAQEQAEDAAGQEVEE
ncbi:MAG: peptide deformylase [Alphaproteobacteria bacterium]|jgi:peptide deformylase|nr:peptide deformylase [Alphaproteobacteria bacterium]